MVIHIQYPPDYDGELHIQVKSLVHAFGSEYQFSFTHAASGTEWETLVKAAEAILAQDRRTKG